jgi:hypothetical protein
MAALLAQRAGFAKARLQQRADTHLAAQCRAWLKRWVPFQLLLLNNQRFPERHLPVCGGASSFQLLSFLLHEIPKP